jgi:predicted PurR-regulated permease PerM
MTAESRPWFVLALTVGIGWLLYRLSPVITPFAISAGLAYLGDPLVDRLQKLRILKWPVSRTVAVLTVFALMVAAFVLGLLIALPMLRDQVVHLVERAPAMFEWLVGTAVPWLQAKLGLASLELDAQSLAEAARKYWKEAGSTLLGVIGSVSRGGGALVNWLVNLLLIPVVTFYLLRDWDNLVAGVRSLLPRKDEAAVSALFGEIDDVLGAFIRGQLMVMLALGVIYAVGLWLIGLDLALIIGASAGLLSIVPYLGTFVGVVAALVAALFQFQDVLHPVLVLAVFAAGQVLEGMVLTPQLVGDRIGLHPVAVIFAVLAGGQLFGFLGILLALPAAAALNVMIRHLNVHYRNSDLYTRPKPGAEEA